MSQSCSLADQKCQPCKGGVPPLTPEEIQPLLKELDKSWQVIQNHHLEKAVEFPNFKDALRFVDKVGEIAEAEGHHPDIFLTWGKVKITIFTHKINGLSKSDFILAAKIDAMS